MHQPKSPFKFSVGQELILAKALQGQQPIDTPVIALTQRSEPTRDSQAIYDVQEVATGEHYPACEHRMRKPIKPYGS